MKMTIQQVSAGLVAALATTESRLPKAPVAWVPDFRNRTTFPPA